MGWASSYIEDLKAGRTVQFRPTGNSMSGRVESGQLVTVEPCPEGVHAGEVVLCRVRGAEYLHLVKAARLQDGRASYLIGNNRGRINGWTPARNVFGRLVRVDT